MKKILVIAILLFPTGIFAQHALPSSLPLTNGEWSMNMDIRMSDILIKEYVLDHPDGIGEYVLSRLDWDCNRLKIAGLNLSWQAFDTGRFTLGIYTALPERVGQMEDYDWAKEDSSGDLTYSGVLSHYSWHKNHLNHYLSCDLNLFFQKGKKIQFLYGAGFQFRVISMDAVDGYLQYTDEENPTQTPDQVTKSYIYGTGITYTYYSFIPYAAAGVQWNISRKIHLSGFTRITPFTWAIGIDNHWLRTLEFTDYLAWDWTFSGTVRLGFRLSPATSLNLIFDLVLQVRAEGNTAVYGDIAGNGEPYEKYVSADTGAASYCSYSAGLQFEFKL